jgi:alpha-tubulin suppressor-like RCC1 family protein
MRGFSFLRAAVISGVVLVSIPLLPGPARAAGGDGSVLAWGSDVTGQLGDGGVNFEKFTPVTVSGLGAGKPVVAVAAGTTHSLALRADGSVVAWGDDVWGQLGDGGTNTARSTPVAVSGLGAGSGVVAVAAGGFHSLALRADGSVLAWGEDGSGQLGDGGTHTNQPTPVAVSGLGAGSGVVAVAGGTRHSLAIRSDGSVLAWGYNFYGQLGDGGAPVNRTVPVAVSGLGAGSGVVDVDGGDNHSLAVRSDGAAGW